MNDISVLGSVMSLYRASDSLKSALHDLIQLYVGVFPKASEGVSRRRNHKQKVKEHQERDTHDQSKKGAKGLHDPATVFHQLMEALKQFEFAFRDFHDYVDVEGEKLLQSLVAQTTVSVPNLC